jgi:hypothetical protein
MKYSAKLLCLGGILASVLVSSAAPATLRMLTQSGYLPGLPVLVRVEAYAADGSRDRETWDGEATLSANGGVTLSTNKVLMRNGAGSQLVTLSGGGNFDLTATVGGVTATRSLISMAALPVTRVGGTLSGGSGTWSGIIAVTNDLTITNYALTIQSNTLVLLNGVTSGTGGADIIVNANASIQSLGTETHPVTITCSNVSTANRWGQIRHNSSQASLYRYTFIHRAGRAPGEGHTGQAPALRPDGTTLTLESCSITDLCEPSSTAPGYGTPGKAMQANNSTLVFNDCLLQRVRMGPEIAGSSLLFTNGYIMDTRGPDDGDGIYLHDQQVGQVIKLVDSVLAAGDDDGIDTLSSTVTVEGCILRDWASTVEDAKAISGFNGVVNVHRCLITDSTVGIAAKANAGTPARINLTQTTMMGNLTNVIAAYKANAPGPIIDIRITNCVLWGGNPIHSDFDGGVNNSTNFIIRYSDVGENWTGAGNINSDPLFVNAAARDLRVQYGSPVINAGAPGSPLDADGTPADMGVFPFLTNPSPLIAFGSSWRYLDKGTDQGTNWQARIFDDSSWSNGVAQLGYGDGDEATVVSYGPDAGNKYITTYFRRAFTVLNPSEFTNLVASLVYDDGAMVYLNGQELFRTNMPAGPINYLTLSAAPIEDLLATYNFSPGLLLTGTNVIAVEIHQQGPGSSDISFNFELVGERGAPPTGPFSPIVNITAPAPGAGFNTPANINITATATDADGTVTNVAFYQNGSLLGQSASGPYAYNWQNVSVGSYTLTAIATDDTGRMGTSAPVNVTVIAPSTLATNTVVAFGDTWRYLDNGTDQGTNWSQRTFNDGSWAAGPAPLGYCTSGCANYGVVTTVGYGPNAANKYPTTYFRKAFTIDNASRVQGLILTLRRDDGALVYINGLEAFRVEMGGGAINYLSYALQAGTYTDLQTTLPPAAVAALVTGTNIIAVEIHQGNASSSDIAMAARLDAVIAAATNESPVVNITAPANNSTYAAPLSTTITANAVDVDGTVTNVAFHVNGVKLVDDANAPYSASWNSVSAGVYVLTAVATDNVGLVTTSSVVNVTVSTNTAPPVVFAKLPLPGNVTNLTSLNVTFSKTVVGVNAGDLLINGVPASGVSGSGSNYTFTFAQPAYGAVAVTWATGHGITDVFTPPVAFNTNSAGANWNYTLLDIIPPTITVISPVPGSTVAGLTSIDVTFSEPVSGVNSSDLLINGAPAGGLSGAGAGPYSFTFPQPPQGVVNVAWTGGHGIVDASANPFAPAPWSYTLDTNVTGVIISEIMYHPSSENVLEEFIELFNKGASAVNLNGWQFSAGVNYTFTNVSIPANGYLVVAANLAVFQAKYPSVTNVVGGWTGVLNNDSEDIDLDDANGDRVDSVTYADEGDWAVRQRGFNDQGFRGWAWLKPHDGGGSSLELINPNLSNNSGQNWGASTNAQGTPGAPNSIARNNIAPLILGTTHFPAVPRSTDAVLITARIVDEAAGGLTVNLRWRVSSASPPAFGTLTMRDDGLLGDASANDGLYSAQIPAQANGSVIEFYVEATDAQFNQRTWPGPAVGSPDGGAGPTGQVANALFQVDNEVYTGSAPLYKMVLTAAENTELGNLLASASSFNSSDAAMNLTFISVDGSGTEVRYLCSVRNRGHGSRIGNPHNYRVGFRSDEPWKDIAALNLNARVTYAQHFGSTLAQRSGVAGGNSRAVQLRINGGVGLGGVPTYNHYAANEDIGGDWADNHFPEDGGGNVYKVVRDLQPPNFNYRGTDPLAYQNTYFKQSNVSENDWTDLIAMLEVMGENRTNLWTLDRARGVINIDQWLRHLAVMTLLGNGESGLNTGNNDDYYMYRGETDPRFILLYHDLDQILGQGGSQGTTESIFRSTQPPISGDSEGTWRTMQWFLSQPDVLAQYYRTLQDLLNTTFSQAEYDALIDYTLTSYVPAGTIANMKSWMDARRSFVQGQINGLVPPATNNPVAVISGEPRSPSPSRNATLTVGGASIVNYRYSLNGGAWSVSTPVGTPITLSNLPQGSTNTVYVVGQNSGGIYQSTNTPTVSKVWIVNTNTPSVRLNEVLASNNGALIHVGTTPDAIELYNDGTASVNLGGLRLTDNKDVPGKFTFPSTVLAAGTYLTVYANNDDGTGGIHTGFTLDPDGDQVYLFDRATNGNNILDSVKFGAQITDLSIGRTGAGGTWALTMPTFGAANTAQALGNENNLKINEWLALSMTVSDFVELYNPNGLPVALGGLYLSDETIGVPNLSRIDDLSFLGANSYLAFTADGDGSIPTHANFQLSSEQGMIGLFSATLQTIDSVSYGPQQPDVAQGKCPNGSATYASMSVPTPGAPNACPFVPPPPVSVSLLTISNVWRYQPRTNYDAVNWTTNTYNDSMWPSGQALLGRQSFASNQVWPEPFRTHIETNLTQTNFYFRGHFNVAAGTTFSSLQFRHIIDDGAVFFLNGVEIPGSRFNMPGGAVNGTTFAASTVSLGSYQGPFSIPVSMLVTGDNVFAVSVHQSANNSSDVAMGVELTGLIVTNSPAAAGVVINEVLANNLSLDEPDGSNPDWVELYNPSTNAVDLGDMSLTDDTTAPRRWVIPGGTILPAQAFMRFRFNADAPASTTNTGFALKANGGGVFLFNRLADGGSVLSSVTYGLQAADFSIGRLPNGSSNWVLTIPTLGSANIVATLANPFSLRINEWMANPSSGQDYFEIYNPNPQPVDISRFYLTDNLSQLTKHQLPFLSFLGIGEDAYQKFDADSAPLVGADHVNFALAAGGEALGLTHSNLTAIDSVSFGPQGAGVSQGRLPDGAAGIVNFPLTPTPGNGNFLPLTTVVINEVLAHTDLPLEDAVEIYNPTGDDVDISGWYLSDSQDNLFKYRIPSNTVVAAGGYKVFYEAQFNAEATLPFSFSSAKGDEVYLSQSLSPGTATGYRAFAKFGASENGVSFGRFPTSLGADYTAMTARTFGVDNPSTVAQFRTGGGLTNVYPKVGPLVINEIMYNFGGGTINDVLEYIELRNITGVPLPLYDVANPQNTWRIREGVDFNFPSNTVVPAGGYLVLVNFDPVNDPTSRNTFTNTYGANLPLVGPYTGRLNNDGEDLEILRPDAPQTIPGPDFGLVPYIVVDRVDYKDTFPWAQVADGSGWSLSKLSSALYGNEANNWQGNMPTPGAANFAAASNTPPTLNTLVNRSAHAGYPVSFTATANDPDLPGQTLTYSLVNTVPAGATIGASSGVFNWTPTTNQISAHTISVRVTDNGSPNLSDTKSFTLTVLALPRVRSVTVSNGVANVTWDSFSGRRYKIFTTPTLTSPNWVQVGGDIIASGPTTTISVGSGSDPTRFYQVLSFDN